MQGVDCRLRVGQPKASGVTKAIAPVGTALCSGWGGEGGQRSWPPPLKAPTPHGSDLTDVTLEEPD